MNRPHPAERGSVICIDELRFDPIIQQEQDWEMAWVRKPIAIFRALSAEANYGVPDGKEVVTVYHEPGQYAICTHARGDGGIEDVESARTWTRLDELTAQAILCHLLGESTDEN